MKHLPDTQCIVHQLLVSILSSQGIHVTDGAVAELASSQAAILLTCRSIACKRLQLVPLPLHRKTCKTSPKHSLADVVWLAWTSYGMTPSDGLQ